MSIFRKTFTFVIYVSLVLQTIGISGQTQTSTTKPATETKKPNDKETSAQKKKTLSPAEKRSYDLLVATLDQSEQIADVTDRSEIVAPAAMLLWKYDQESARTWLKSIVDSLFDEFERYANNTDAIKKVAKLIASRDSALSLSILDRLNELNQKYSNSKSSAAISAAKYREDRLNIAEEAVGSDSKQAAQIALDTVGSSVPITFVNFLYKLAQNDKAQADALFRQTLSVLSSGSTYHLNDVITLSVYAFKEEQVLMPTIYKPAGSTKESYATFMLNPYNGTVPALDPAIAIDFLNAGNNYMTLMLSPGGPGVQSDMRTLGECFFLVNKLGAYARFLNPSSVESWQQLRARVLDIMNGAGIDPGQLSDQSGFVDRLSKGEPPVKSYDGAADFEKAEKTADKTERDNFLARGIVALANQRKYDEADKKVQKVSDSVLASRLHDYINIRAAGIATQESRWAEVQSRAAQISDPAAHIYVLLKGADATVKSPKTAKTTTAEFINEATRLTDKLDRSESKTKMLIIESGLFYRSGDIIRGGQVMASAIHDLNGDKPVTEKQPLSIFTVYKNYSIGLVVNDWDFDSSFKEAASKDWDGALMLINGIQSPKMRLSAQIAAAQASPLPGSTEVKESKTSN